VRKSQDILYTPHFLSTTAGLPQADLRSSLIAADWPPCRHAAPRQAAQEAGGRDDGLVYNLSHCLPTSAALLERLLRDGQKKKKKKKKNKKKTNTTKKKCNIRDSHSGMFTSSRPRPNDLSRRNYAENTAFHARSEVSGALTIGGDKLAVDGVLLSASTAIPDNDQGAETLSALRKKMFGKSSKCFAAMAATVARLCDKPPVHDRKQGARDVRHRRKLGLPSLRRSELPVHLAEAGSWSCRWARRIKGTRGGVARRDGELRIHALWKRLQCMWNVAQGQQGVQAVTCLEGEAVVESG